MRIYRPTWTAKDGQQRRSKRHWLDFVDSNGHRWRFPGLVDVKQTEALGRNVEKLIGVKVSGDALPADLLRWLEDLPDTFRQRLADAGLIDPERAGGLAALMVLDDKGKIIGGHLADFLADAKARGVSPIQRQMLAQRIRDVLLKARCTWLRDLSASRIQSAIASLGEPTEDNIGLSKQSLTHYVRAVKQFSKWLQRERRTTEDMLVGLKTYNAETDKRHERRGFTADEMSVLLSFTARAPTRWGMTGPARTASYWLAFASGLRRNEIRTLTKRSFNLAVDPPTVRVEAGYSKHRREDVQPLPADVANAMAEYLRTADSDCPFPLPGKTGKMLHVDMIEARAAAGISAADFLVPRDSAGLVLDFHSFRHGYVTEICKANVSPRVMMALARHSDPRLTMKRYSRIGTIDTAKALDCLPRLTDGMNDDSEAAVLQATGTGDSKSHDLASDRLQGRLDLLKRSEVISEATMHDESGQQNTSPENGQSDRTGRGKTASKIRANIFAKHDLPGYPFVDSCGRESENGDGEKTEKTLGNTRVFEGKRRKAPVAQLDRASVFGTEGYRFESCRAC